MRIRIKEILTTYDRWDHDMFVFNVIDGILQCIENSRKTEKGKKSTIIQGFLRIA